MARPSKYTPETAKKCYEAITLGVKAKTQIAAYADISPDTFDRWLVRYADFAAGVKKAEAQRTAKALARIHQAAPTHWQAAAWLLERIDPDNYGKTVTEQQHVFKTRQVAERVAASLGLDPDEVLAEAERIVAEAG